LKDHGDAAPARRLTTCPSIRTCPDVGFSKPAMIRSNVVLPHPDGPSSTMNSPSRASRLMPLTATTSPNFFLISLTATATM
jgi:hypothetical protein